MADEQPLQAHLRDKPAKELSAEERGANQCQINWHPAANNLNVKDAADVIGRE